ncbi:MAG: helix-turn-helix transcriptional regulator [Candidatus Sericytochromatia bacterium]
MYSPTTRLLGVLELLQSYPCISGPELARRLEVDGRTIRRYLARLQEMGIPIEAEHGPQGAYRLRRGYKIPPLMLTDGEAVALTLGLMAIRDLGLSVDRAAVIGALAKTERVMPEALHARAQALQAAITFHLTLYQTPTALAWITQLSEAVQQCRQVQLCYQAWGQAVTERVFEPYGIVMNEGCWYTAGYCRWRQGLRTFRLDRIQALEMLDTRFERPADFDTLAHVLAGLSQGGEQIEVLLHTDLATAQELCGPEMGSLEAVPEGVMLRRGAYHLEWVAHFLLQLEILAEVRQPLALRELLRAQGLRALHLAGLSPDAL